MARRQTSSISLSELRQRLGEGAIFHLKLSVVALICMCVATVLYHFLQWSFDLEHVPASALSFIFGITLFLGGVGWLIYRDVHQAVVDATQVKGLK